MGGSSLLSSVLEIARHELAVMLRTRRAVLMAALYLGAAVIGGLAMVLIARSIEQSALEALLSQGLSPENAAAQLREAAEPAFRQAVSWFAGTEPADMAPSLRESLVLPVFLWCSLVALPFLILLTSFDQLAAPLERRSLCYSVLRAPRAAIVLGKLAAHTLLFTVLTMVSSTALVAIAVGLLGTDDFAVSLFGLVRLWVLLVPFGLVYLGISSFCSASASQPFSALLMSLGTIVVLRILLSMPQDGALAPLRVLRYASPAYYHEGFWQSGLAGPAASALAYLAIATVFVALAIRRLGARDL